MTKAFFPIQCCAFLFLFGFITSCNGQVKKNAPENRPLESKASPAGHPKIIKMPGAGPRANVDCGLQDKAGNLWFGTTGQGVYRYDGKAFVNFTEKDGLNNNNVYAILEDRSGQIWFGTNAGLCRYDGKTFTNIPIGVTNGNFLDTYKITDAAPKAPPAPNAVWSIMQDSHGKLWFGTFNEGIYCFDGKAFTHFLHNDGVINESKLKLMAVNSIIEDRQGNIWFATWFEGLCRYNGKTISSFKPNGEVWFSFLLEDKKGDIWIGRRTKGVCRYNGKTFTNVLQHGTFDSCNVRPLAEDKNGNIWFGTMHGNITKRKNTGGLWRYADGSFKNFTPKDGLPNNAVWCVVEDRAGNLWMGTTGSDLFKYDGKTFTNFSE